MAFQYRPTHMQLHSAGRFFVVGALVVTSASPSWASLNFPQHLIQTYDWGGQPSECTLCHTNNNGGAGTITKPFGNALKSNGLAGVGNTASLDAAILALGDTDSDGDGASDVDELTLSGDPNDPAVIPGGFVASEPVEYGCVGGTISRSSESSPTSALVASGFVAAVLLWSRRRRGA